MSILFFSPRNYNLVPLLNNRNQFYVRINNLGKQKLISFDRVASIFKESKPPILSLPELWQNSSSILLEKYKNSP